MQVQRSTPERLLLAALLSGATSTSLVASPPYDSLQGQAAGSALPPRISGYMTERGFLPRVKRAKESRQAAPAVSNSILFAAPIIADAVEGTVHVPVVPVHFSDAAPPYLPAELDRRLFANTPGTMRDYYRDVSRGKLEVRGEVLDWTELPLPEAHYSGPLDCQTQSCDGHPFVELLLAAMGSADRMTDFASFDNDGPDGRPNSGDDDGYVDFIAIVHSAVGGECGSPAGPIRSHRLRLSEFTGQEPFATQDAGANGGQIFIDDYVIAPALACDGVSMIDIGVFAHEFGHAFGLPDLYDTVHPSDSYGIGVWGLMATGSFGNPQGTMPGTPARLSAWSRQYLGWVTPREITEDTRNVHIRPIGESGDAVRVDYTDTEDPSDKRYLLLEYRIPEGYDAGLPGPGLVVMQVDDALVEPGLADNGVNRDRNSLGINVIEADGKLHLNTKANRGDAGDPFPGSSNAISTEGNFEHVGAALCNITVHPDWVSLDIYTSRTTCPEDRLAQDWGELSVGDSVTLQGVIRNRGTNFFTDRNLVLESETGLDIPIKPPALPDAIPTIPGLLAPRALDDILGRRVTITGTVVRQPRKGRGLTEIIEVERLEVTDN